LSLRLRQNNRPYGYRGLKIFTSLKLRFQDFQRVSATDALNLAIQGDLPTFMEESLG
ncbi:hypothetical protein BMETH_2815155327223, partial [methanotrophic bacterial endosymbiont of Bathymodiolus sp.]